MPKLPRTEVRPVRPTPSSTRRPAPCLAPAAQFLTLLLLLAATPALAADRVEGTVRTSQGVPIEHAEVRTTTGAGKSSYTDARGAFALDCDVPCTLLVLHPRFVETAHDITEAGVPAEITLRAKQEYFERIDVTAERTRTGVFRAASVASTEIRVDEKASTPQTLVELVEGVAGVAENGQPGLFQVYAIRGVSAHRVLTFVDGIQIMGERRAGVASSFVDPTLMGRVDVLRGPSSTYYGSGALGGVVQVFPKEFDGLEVDAGWEDFGNETWQRVGWGEDGWSLAVARRTADDDRVADGTLQNTHFTQYSATLIKTWRQGDREWEVFVLPALADDIGKPNIEFPNDRITNYPREEHLLARLSVVDDGGWSADLWVHPNALDTEVTRPGRSFSVVENQAFDLGGEFQWSWTAKSGLAGTLGFDWFGRRGVRADETEDDLREGTRTTARTLDGDEDQVAAFGSVRWKLGAAEVQAGTRLTFLRQSNIGAESRDDTAWTGFVGLVRPLGKGFELAANVGTGLRFANLSERFFVGTTGRGQVIGNPNLEPEESLNVDAGLRFYGQRTFLSAQVFRLEVDDYIERIDVADGTRTYVNLTAGTIQGFELEGFAQLTEQWRLGWSGHILDGEADDGSNLADISSDRVQLTLDYQNDRWTAKLRLQHRFAKNDPGPSEVPVAAADLLSASLGYDLTESFRVTLRGENLLDETYASSADDLASAAPGRSVGVGVRWVR